MGLCVADAPRIASRAEAESEMMAISTYHGTVLAARDVRRSAPVVVHRRVPAPCRERKRDERDTYQHGPAHGPGAVTRASARVLGWRGVVAWLSCNTTCRFFGSFESAENGTPRFGACQSRGRARQASVGTDTRF